MLVNVDPKPINDITSSHILQQTSYWGHVKQKQGWDANAYDVKIILEEEGEVGRKKVEDDLLIVSQKIGESSEIAYIPYGPKNIPAEGQQGNVLEELSENLREHLPDETILIRYDLPWGSPYAQEEDFCDENGMWLGPPEPRVREFRMNFGTNQWNLRKAPTDVLPSSTFLINLSLSEEKLLQQMKPKTRYNIRLAYKKGAHVYEAGEEGLPIWYDLHCQTAERNKIISSDRDFFKTLLQAKEECPGDTCIKFLIAEVEGNPLAAMFLIISGGRATYLYGASSNKYRQYMGAYALQWQAIKTAKSLGCVEYDMFGVAHRPDPSHPMYGLYKFKSGFGGNLHHREGCWDYPLDESMYIDYKASELALEGFHHG
ncbi:peptidoglycan bridge formation glycyltransferase FemA/FemB family protein [Cytophagaceae bacterium ABcell3]|nr:peptidoglycan bridge formation glycyltransferase FemA/FemB family protein [Cytophagaceae bacterium ABcell3]